MTARCPHCAEAFTRPSSLTRHVRSKHAEVMEIYPCPKCSKTFARPDILRRHEQNHHGNGMGLCTTCSQPFRKDYLKQHSAACISRKPSPGRLVLQGMAPPSTTLLDQTPEDQVWMGATELPWQLDFDIDLPSTADFHNHVVEVDHDQFITVPMDDRQDESHTVSDTNSDMGGGSSMRSGNEQELGDLTRPILIEDGNPNQPQQEGISDHDEDSCFDYDRYGHWTVESAFTVCTERGEYVISVLTVIASSIHDIFARRG